MLVTWDTGVSVHESAIVVMANMANIGKTVQVVRWSSRKRRVVQAPAESATGEMIFPGPRFPQKSPQMGERQFFPTLPQKMPILFHSGNKRHFKLCSKSVSNYQNQLVEAEKLFKKSHIFAWFHCIFLLGQRNHSNLSSPLPLFFFFGKYLLSLSSPLHFFFSFLFLSAKASTQKTQIFTCFHSPE